MPATLEQVRARITAGEDADGSYLADFAEALFEKADPAFLEAFDADAMVAMARSGLTFLDRRGGDGPVVEVLDPSSQTDGWEGRFTVVRLTMRDRPFIVDSVRAELMRQGVGLFHLLHPIYHVVRDPEGRIQTLGDRVPEGTPEAFEMYFVEGLDAEEDRARLQGGITRVLGDVEAATDDYHPMLTRAVEVRNGLRAVREGIQDGANADRAAELEEYEAFLDWLREDHFVFLGYREYDIVTDDGTAMLQVTRGSGLGILRDTEASTYARPVSLDDLPPGLRERVTGGHPLIVTKTNTEATVHRAARMDYVGVKKLDEALQVQGEQRFLGLFTSKALSTPVGETPILRRKLRGVLQMDDALPGSHDYKEIVTVFDSMPRSELFWSDTAQLHRDIRTVMALEQERGVKLTVRPDPLQRGLGVMVIMPRERFDTDVRRRIQRHLARRLQARHVDYHLAMGEDEAQVRFHFFFSTDLRREDVDVRALDREVAELSRSWDDHVREQLDDAHGTHAGRRLAERYLPRMDDRYKADARPAQAVRDIANLEALGDEVARVDLLDAVQDAEAGQVSILKVYHHRPTLVLSEVLPVLENLGLRVLEQVAYPLRDGDGVRGIDVFRVQDARGGTLDVRRDGERLVAALERLLAGGVISDRLNRLVLRAGVSLRQVALVRAYQMYYTQLNAATSRSFVNDALLAHPAVAAALLRYHDARLDPSLQAPREEAMERTATDFHEALGEVSSLPEDRTLRGLFDLMQATVRTNYYAGSPLIAFKIASDRVAEMPEPRPMFEIGVSGYGVEGTHLRGGRVARGGIRWSDRPDDFRTEILGLMKTQMTKNAVIVPVGSKGGFVVKHAPSDREALRGYVEAQYRAYVGALLELTDDRDGDEIVHPPGMVVHDEPDPYLVVAADKGTASFSDTANEVAFEHGYWLGDAFASGGSHGYDHKEEAITARGAWRAVDRHFREMGLDSARDTFTVAGIGDMSGDVFGNGMLHTPTLRLQAAFNHRHVFLDPDPDPEASYRERQRLFELPRSGWNDYDRSLISAGGGVFPRDAKSIPLSPEAREALGVREEALSGRDLIRAILRMRVDLLWNGGIGTYVKAASERHADVGDSANDAVRVDAHELRCRVVGEGGNLGFTQLGRVAFARAGGRINTDAIDNSGGVDMSDREVNIKILLQPLLAGGELSFEQRNRLLDEMTDEVSELVLNDNDRQALALSLAERRAREDPTLFASLQEYLEERGGLDAGVEDLPNRKARTERKRNAETYTRPELAILLAYAKMGVYRRLLETDFPSDPYLERTLFAYFPSQLRERFPDAVRAHPLRREIVATQITNAVVDLLGITFVHRTIRDSGATPVDTLRAALVGMELLDAPAFIQRVDGLDAVDADTRYHGVSEMVRAVEGVVSWILLNDMAGQEVHAFVETYAEPLAYLRGELVELQPGADRRHLKRRIKQLDKRGFTPEMAREVAVLDYLPPSIGAIEVSRATEVPLDEAASRFYGVGERLRLGWLRDRLRELPAEAKWDKIALAGLVMDLRQAQQDLAMGYVRAAQESGARSPQRYLATLPGLLDRFDAALAEIEEERSLGLASGVVLVRMLARPGR
ncbi:MAG: NAD-glutamate dehydrogenase [Trueperaceae bacterium]|nr:NAD-glutamate dehydrogenase [Trueperaceae bacterium]